MGKKLQPKILDSIIGILPKKEQDKLRAQDLSPEWLEENIAYCKGLIKRAILVRRNLVRGIYCRTFHNQIRPAHRLHIFVWNGVFHLHHFQNRLVWPQQKADTGV